MKESFFKKIFVKRNALISVISIIFAVIATFTYSISTYSNNINTVKISLKENDIINKIVVNKNEMSLTDFVNGDLSIVENEKKEVEYLICNKPSDINIQISVVDNIDINFNNNDIMVTLDGVECGLANNSFTRINNIFNITLNSISSKSILIFVALFVVLYIALYLFIKVLDKIKEDKFKIYDIILVILSCFVIYLSTIYYLMAINKFLALLPALCMLGFICYYLRLKFTNWQNLFLSLVVVVGTNMIFIIPPGNVPDEPAHFARSFAEYNIYIHDEKDNVHLPVNFEMLMHKYVHNVHSMTQKFSGLSYISELIKNPEYNNLIDKGADYENTKYLSFLPYLPSGIINLIGRILNLPILVLFLLSRLVNFIISTTLCYYAIKITPKFKKMFVIIALFPIFLQQAAGVDMDYLTNSVSFLFIAFILKYRYEDIKIEIKQLIILSCLAIALALCKFGYFPLLGLVFLISNNKFKNEKIAIIFKIIYITLPIVISYFCNFGSVSHINDKSDYYTIEKVISNPVNSLKMCLKTLAKRFELDLFRGLLDGFGWSTKYHIDIIRGLLCFIFIILLFCSDEENKICIKDRILIFSIFLVIFGILYAIAFTEWTPISFSSINGLQSRYFIPISILFYISISNNMIKINVKNKYRFYMILMSFAQIISLFSIINCFY